MIRLADINDIEQVTDLRMKYLSTVYSLDGKLDIIKKNNWEYLNQNLNRRCYVAVGFCDGELCSCAYMSLLEKAANLRFANGIYGEIYGVFTLPEYRGRGFATELMKLLIFKGREIQLPFIKLEASADGYHIYKNIGFKETDTGYIDMALPLSFQ